jgi:hypothetical protein
MALIGDIRICDVMNMAAAYGIPQSLGELLNGEDTGEVFRDSALLGMPAFQMAYTRRRTAESHSSLLVLALSCVRSISSALIRK